MASSALSVAVPKTEKALKAGWGFKCNQRHTSWQRRYQPTRTKTRKVVTHMACAPPALQVAVL